MEKILIQLLELELLPFADLTASNMIICVVITHQEHFCVKN